MHIGIVAGTGPAGRGLAARLALSGARITIGSRSVERAELCASGLRSEIAARGVHPAVRIDGGENADCAEADVVVIAAPWEAAEATVSELVEALKGKVVVSMANALAKVRREMVAVMHPRGSMAEAIQAVLPNSFVSGAFHHLPAGHLIELERTLDSDVLVVSDYEKATEVTCDLVKMIPRLRPLVVGSLSQAAAVEGFTAVLVGVNKRYSCSASVRLSGVGDGA